MYGPGVAGDKQGKEVRRTLKALGIRPDKDKAGRKWKGPCSEKQKPKRPRGRPRTGEVDWFTTSKLEAVEAKVAHSLFEKTYGSLTPENEPGYGWREKNRQELMRCRKVLKDMNREIEKLTMRRGGRRGNFVY
jgi:hypothetical protein